MQSPESSIDWHDTVLCSYGCAAGCVLILFTWPHWRNHVPTWQRERERDTEMQSQATCLMEFIKMEVYCCTL